MRSSVRLVAKPKGYLCERCHVDASDIQKGNLWSDEESEKEEESGTVDAPWEQQDYKDARHALLQHRATRLQEVTKASLEQRKTTS